MDFVLSFSLLAFCLVLGFWRIGGFFNPVSLFTFGLLIAEIAILISDQVGLLRFLTSSDSHAVLKSFNLATICFMIPWTIRFINTNKTNYIFFDNIKYRAVYKWLSIFLIVLLCLAFALMGGTPIIRMMLGTLNVDEYNASLINLPFGFLTLILSTSILLNLYLSSLIANRSYYKVSTISIVLLTMLCLIASLWQGKRQGLLMLIFMIVARLGQKKSTKTIVQKLKTGFIATIIAVVFFFVFTQVSKVRTNSSEADSFELISYAMYPAMNMVTIINHYPGNGTTFLPKHVLSEMIPWRFVSSEGVEEENFLFEPTSPSGYFSNWFMDYGYFGIIVGAFFMSVVSLYAFTNRLKSEHHMRIYVFILWCCVTVGVYSHLLNLNFFVFPFLLLVAINKIKFSFT